MTHIQRGGSIQQPLQREDGLAWRAGQEQGGDLAGRTDQDLSEQIPFADRLPPTFVFILVKHSYYDAMGGVSQY